jgi:hypothetical protein
MNFGLKARQIPDRGLKNHVAGNGRCDLAKEKPFLIRLPLTQRLYSLDLVRMFVGIETADQTFSVRISLAFVEVDGY